MIRKLYQNFIKIPLAYRLFMLFIVLSLIVLKGGYFGQEQVYRYYNYLDDRPFLLKIFDAERHTALNFEARELSFVFDFIDANFILYSAKYGIIHFYSLTHYIFIFIIACLAYLISKKFFGQRFTSVSILVCLLFLTAPTSFIGIYFRSAKILVSLFLVITLYLLFSYSASPKKGKICLLLITLSTFLMSVSDKQGFFYTAVLCGITGIIFITERTRKYFFLFLSLLAVVALYIFYSNSGGPWLIQKISGQAPIYYKDEFYVQFLKSVPEIYQQILLYLTYQFSIFFGNIPLMGGALIAIVFGVIYLITIVRNRDSLIIKISAIPFIQLLASFLLIGAMLHYSMNLLTRAELRVYYYPDHTIVLILLVTQFVLARFLTIFPKFGKPTGIVLGIILFMNIVALPKHYYDNTHDTLLPGYTATPVLRKCIRQSDIPREQFGLLAIDQHAYDTCLIFRTRIKYTKMRCIVDPGNFHCDPSPKK